MLANDFRGEFGPEKFSVKHLNKIVTRELKAEGWVKMLRGTTDEVYDESILKHQR